MKTSHNLNNAMHAHDSLFVHCEAYPLFHYYEPHTLFVIMSLTLSLLLCASRSLRYYDPHALFVIMNLTLSLLFCVRALCFTTQTLYSYSLQIMLSSNTINQST